MNWFETKGTLLFDPPRPGMKTRTAWWCVIALDDQIADYYRWHLDRNWWMGDTSSIKRGYHKPSWGAHISVIRGEKPRMNMEQWAKNSGRKVTIRYNGMIRQTKDAVFSGETDKFWFIDAEWDEYASFRKQFGLTWQVGGKPFRPHITIARTYD